MAARGLVNGRGPPRSGGRDLVFTPHHTDILLIISIEQSDCLHTCEKLLQQVALVWRVDSVTLEAEAHKKRINAEDALKISKDRNRTTST